MVVFNRTINILCRVSLYVILSIFFFFSSRRRHTRWNCDWSSDVCSSDLDKLVPKGLSFVPQEKNVFTSMSVEENLEMGAFTRKDDFSTTLDWVYDMFPVLDRKSVV